MDRYYINDLSNDGNNVYGHVTFYYLAGGYWYQGATKSTGEFDYWNTPRVVYVSDTLKSWGTAARTGSKVCVQLGWPVPDSCSASTYASVSY